MRSQQGSIQEVRSQQGSIQEVRSQQGSIQEVRSQQGSIEEVRSPREFALILTSNEVGLFLEQYKYICATQTTHIDKKFPIHRSS